MSLNAEIASGAPVTMPMVASAAGCSFVIKEYLRRFSTTSKVQVDLQEADEGRMCSCLVAADKEYACHAAGHCAHGEQGCLCFRMPLSKAGIPAQM